jgi:DNA polymerase III delta prime subunit
MQHQTVSRPVSLFCVAASTDTALLTQWETHLLPLRQAGQIIVWSEQHATAGAPRTELLHKHLEQAHVIMFLLSAEFFASDECMTLMQQALLGKTHIIPLLVSPVDWKESKLSDLDCLPMDGTFVTNWKNQADAFHTCVQDLRKLLDLPTIPPQSGQQKRALTLQNQNRVRMLGRLHLSYNDLMSQSLHGTAWLELDMAEKPNAVQNASHLLLRMEDRPEQPLPPGTSIMEAYYKANRELLILGEPGSGKSTLLLNLAKHLVMQAEQDETHPLPVILPLSSWAIKHLPLQDWITEQLTEVYDVPRRLGTQWQRENEILLLLDGLDEMEETSRPACIIAINAYHRDHMAAIVVCSRTTEYETAASRHRLILQRAVVVQTLTHEDVDTSLVQAGKPLAALHNALKKNAALRELATTPLILNILILTYQGTSVRSLSSKQSLLLQQVWNDYIRRMVARKGNSKRYPLRQTQVWLSWLARKMREHNQTIFYMEHLQPTWLSPGQQHIYDWLAIRLPVIFVGVLITLLTGSLIGGTDSWLLLQYGVLGGFLGGLWHSPLEDLEGQGKRHHVWIKRLIKRLVISACIGLVSGLSFGPSYDYYWQAYDLSYGIVIGLGSLLLQYLLTIPFHAGTSSIKNTSSQSWKRVGSLFQKVRGPRIFLVTVIFWLGFGLSTGLTAGLSYILINLILKAETGNIRLTERLRWTQRSLRKGLFKSNHLRIALFLTCCIIISVGLSNGLDFIEQGTLVNLTEVSNGLVFTKVSNWLIPLFPVVSSTSGSTTFSKTFYSDFCLGGYVYGPFKSVADNSALVGTPTSSTGTNIGLRVGLSVAVSTGISYWFLVGLFQSTDQERIEDQERHVPNQGIRHSLNNSMIMCIISSIVIGIIGILNFELSIGLSYELLYLKEGLSNGLSGRSICLIESLSSGLHFGLLMGISSGLLIYTLTGGLAAWRHYIIRFLLWHSHTFPWKTPQFLNDASARFLLRQVGGGYSFAHRLLLDYFADQGQS